MQKYYVFILLFSMLSCKNVAQNTTNMDSKTTPTASLYDFTVTDLYGDTFNMADLKGKKVMVVNTASKCGLTPQYKDLQALYEKYQDQNFVIIGFPANDFMQQEPGSNEDIATFCEVNYGVTFPMMAKIVVKGEGMHPLYQFLTRKSLNGLQDNEVEWNFQKYLINEEGALEMVVSPRTLPTDTAIINWITS